MEQPPAMPGWTWPLGRIAGIPIRVHWTFGFLLPLVLPRAAADPLVWWLDAAHGLVLVGGLFGCVILHELGHSLMARRHGIGVRDITLLPIGGVARLEVGAGTLGLPGELAIALAGPAVNLALATLLLPLAWAVSGAATAGPAALPRELGQFSPAGLVVALLLANTVLAAFNLLPIFPMDGGRVLRAALALRGDPARATRQAALVGQVLALALVAVGIATTSLALVLVAVLLVVGCGRELAAARPAQRALPVPAAPGEPSRAGREG
jgi:Zn-dependent protease